MKTIQLPVAEVTVGMMFIDTVANRLDPLFGTEVVKTVTKLIDDGGGYTTVMGVRLSPDYLGNNFAGGPGKKNTSTLTVVTEL